MKQQQSYPLRLPSNLKVWAQKRAVDNDRTLNSEIINILKTAKKKDEAHKKAPKTAIPEASTNV